GKAAVRMTATLNGGGSHLTSNAGENTLLRRTARRRGKNVPPAGTGGTRLSFQLVATSSPEQRLRRVFTGFADRAARRFVSAACFHPTVTHASVTPLRRVFRTDADRAARKV